MRTKPLTFFTAIFLCIMLTLASCTGQAQPADETPPAADTESPQATEAPAEEEASIPAPDDTAVYTITFIAQWSAESHPGQYPSNAHFSPFIAVAHNSDDSSLIFAPGELSSPGMKEMAETGATALLEDEINAINSDGGADGYVKGSVFDSPGSVSADLAFTQTHSRVTFVSMIAPSPDWFVSAQAELFSDGDWVDELELVLSSYDAGTDSGPELTSANSATNPPENIQLLPDALQGMGTLVLTRNK